MKALEQILSDMQLMISTVVVLTAILAFPPSKVWFHVHLKQFFVVAECLTPLTWLSLSQFIHVAYNKKQALEVRRAKGIIGPFIQWTTACKICLLSFAGSMTLIA